MLFSRRDVCKLVLPLILQQILSTMTGMINSIMVSRAGEAAVSGVSLITTLDNLLIIAFTALVTGGSVVVSQAMGRKDQELVQNSAKQLLYSVTIIASLVTLIVFTLRVPLLNLLFGDAEPDVMYHALNYFSIISLSFPLLAIYNAGAALFRVMGNSFISMILSFLSNVLVIFGNLLFITKMEMGAAGAALSTLISRLLFAVIIIVMLHNKKRPLYLEKLFHYRPDFKVIKRILQIGVPTGIENSMHSFGKLLTQTLVASMGTIVVAANSVALSLANFQYMAGNAIGSSIITIVGRCIGAGEKEQAKKYSRILLGISYAILFLVSLITLLFSRQLLSLYGLSAESTSVANQLLRFHTIVAVVIWPLGFVLPPAFRAAGDAKFPMTVASLSMWIFRVAGAYILGAESLNLFGLTIPGFGFGILGVWIAMFADWGCRALFYGWRYFSGQWLKRFKEI